MSEMCKSCMTRREMLKSTGRFSAALVAAGGVPSIVADAAELASGGSADKKLDRRCLLTVLRMGHCAPSVMDTLLDGRVEDYENIVRLTSGLPGGIGNSGAECGGVTSPVMFMGLESASKVRGGDLLDLVVLGRSYMERFRKLHGTIYCREIQTPDGGISPCLRAICSGKKLSDEVGGADLKVLKFEIGDGPLKSYSLLLRSFQERSFHCAHTLFDELSDVIDVNEILLEASRGFVGGTMLSGETCGALTAGVLAIGSKIGEIEDSYIRVMIMMGKMMTGKDAMADDVNKFNRSINVGNRLAVWFEGRFGSTRCVDITKTDFSDYDGVRRFVSSNRVESCRKIAREVAKETRKLLSDLSV